MSNEMKSVKGSKSTIRGIIRFTIVLMMGLIVCQYAAAEDINWKSTWKNKRGSLLFIESIDCNGKITGTYINNAPGYGCQNTPYRVVGWVLGNAITFTVRWENTSESCKSITAWAGFYSKGKITTLWQLVRDKTTSTTKILKGEDEFERVPPK